MRMHPGVSYPLERVVPSNGARLCDKDIPAGTIVSVNPAAIDRNADIFGGDADTFRSERWLDNDVGKIKTMDRYLLMVSTVCYVAIASFVEISRTKLFKH